jgi:hypothetical protein
MATTTAPRVTREILAERWHMVSVDARQFAGEDGPSEAP